MLLHVLQNKWFQHVSSPVHFTLEIRGNLDQRFGLQWKGRRDPIAWSIRSPDLTPIDYYLWGFKKTLIYDTPVESKHEL